MSILIHKLCKKLGDTLVLDRVSFFVNRGDLVAILGPSGSGKSTLLRSIAGLDPPLSGTVWLNGFNVTDTPPQFRRMSFVFQDYALFKHMTVRENIEFGLKLRNFSAEDINERVNPFIKAFRMEEFALRYPSKLSGGEKQRVALARSLVIEPRYLLLDEPFGALDEELRRKVVTFVRAFLKKHEITTLMVTHDQKEAIKISNEIIIFDEGRVIQHNKPKIVYDSPLTVKAGKFLGPFLRTHFYKNPSNIIQSRRNLMFFDDVWKFTFADRPIDRYDFYLRPHEIQVQNEPNPKASRASIRKIKKRRYTVELYLLLLDFSWYIVVHMSNKAFKNLKIKSLDQILYVRPRPWAIQRTYFV